MIDEARISASVLSANWIWTEFNNQKFSSTFYTVGSGLVPPAITSANSTTFTIGTLGWFTFTATGSPAPTLSESGTLPSGVTFEASTGSLYGTAASGTNGTYPITFTASNGVGTVATQSFTLTVQTYDASASIASADHATFMVGTSGSFTVTASGSPTPTLSESGTLPSGISFTASTGVLSGTAASGTSGTYPITFTASNGVGSNDTQSFILTVEPNPAITSANNSTFLIGTSGSFTVTATGSPTPTFSESGTLPSGVSFTTSTGVLSGIPASGTSGTYPITFTASNGSNTNQSFTLTVDTAGTVFYYLDDSLGTSRVITTATGAVCYDGDFYPFGGERAYTDTCDSTYKFTGKERDSESGLDNFGARYNSSQYGRFMTPDPKMPSLKHLVNPQKWNKYAYTINNPLRYFDPDGMEEIEVVLRAFIQQRTVTDPVGRTFAGDNRGFSSAAGASSRTSITVRIETDASKSANPILSVTPSVSPTRLLDANGNQISSQLAQGAPSVSGTRDANGSVVLNFKQDVINPYEPQLSILGIKSDLNVTVPQNGSSITAAGTTSGFPAFELNVTPEGQPTSNIPLNNPSGGPGSIVNTNLVFTQRPLPPPPPCNRDRDQQCQ